MRRALLATTLVGLLCPAAANANWFRSWYGPRVAYYYAPPSVVYYVPAAPVVPLPCPPPLVPAVGVQVTPAPPPLAVPQAAPPSRSPEPPPAVVPPPVPVPAPAPAPPAPAVGEQRFYDGYAASGRGATAGSGDRVSVGFWNLSGQDMVVVVADQRVTLLRGASTTVQAPRQFTWQVAGRPMLSEAVPIGESAWEIVIRK